MPNSFQESSYYGSEIDPMTGLQPKIGTSENQSFDPMLGVWNSPIPAIHKEDQELGSKYDTSIEPFVDVNRIRGERQSGIAQLGSALNQAIVGQVIGGTIEGVGYLLDLPQYAKLAEGTEQEFGNWFSDLGNSISQWSEKETPIYTTYKPGEFSPGHWSWWMSNAPSVASTLSLVVPAAGAVRGLEALGKLAKLGDELGVATKWVAKGVTEAVISRHMETMMDSNQTYNEVFNKGLSLGMVDEEAKKKASIAASKVYKLEWACIAQDIPQYLLLNRAFNSAALENTLGIASKMGESMLPVVGKKAAAIGWDMLTEGAEEAYQYIVQQEGEYVANKHYDPSLKKSFADRLDKYTSDGDFWTQGLFGGLGAGVTHTVGHAINQYMTQGKIDPRVEDINSWGEQFSYWNKRMREGQESGDENAERFSKDSLWTTLGVKSAQLGNIENARDFLKAMQNPTKEDLERFNVSDEDLKVFQSEIPKGMEKLKRVGKIYNDNTKKYDPAKAAMVTYTESLLEDQVVNENRLKGATNEDLTKIPNLTSLPANVQSLLMQTIDNKLIEKRINFFDVAANKAEGSEKERYQKHANDLRDQLSKNLKLIDELELTKDEKELQSHLIKYINNTLLEKEINSLETSISNIEESKKEKYQKHIDILKERLSKNMENIKTIGIESKGLEDYLKHKQELGYTRHATLDLQKDLEQIKKQNFLSTEEDRVKHKQSKEEKIKENAPYTPTTDDIVVHNSPEGQQTVARLNKVDEEGHATITPIDQDGKETGPDQVVDKDNLSLYQKENKDLKETLQSTESVNEDETPTISKKLYGESKRGLRDVSASISHSNFDEDQQKTVVRNKEYDLHVSSPKNTLEGDKVKFAIDTSNDPYKTQVWKVFDDLKKKLDSGNKFSKEEIDDIVGSRRMIGTEDDFSSVVDLIPIKINYTSRQGKEFNNGLYYHDSAYDNIYIPPQILREGQDKIDEFVRLQKEKTRKYRKLILTALLSGQTVELLNVKKTIGIPNNTDVNRKIDEVLKQDANTIKLAIVDSTGTLWTGHNSEVLEGFGTPGNIFISTTKTCNGEEGTIKCNISKLTPEHANILFNAILTKFREGSGGNRAVYEGDEVTSLTVGQTIDLLTLFGPATNINHPNNIERDMSHLENKQLFIEGDNLHYGKNVVSLKTITSDKANAELERNKFVDWATMFKNYAVSKQNKELEIELNKPMNKVFKIGSWVSEGKDTYAGSIIKNGLVKTDVQEFEDTGSLFHAPVTIIDLSESGLDIRPIKDIAYETEIKRVSKQKPTTAKEQKEQDIKIAEEVKLPPSELDKIKSLPVNSNIHVGVNEYDTNEKGEEVKITVPKLFISIVSLKGVKYFQLRHPRTLIAFGMNPSEFDGGNKRVEITDENLKKLSSFLKGYANITYDTSKSFKGLEKELISKVEEKKVEPKIEETKEEEKVLETPKEELPETQQEQQTIEEEVKPTTDVTPLPTIDLTDFDGDPYVNIGEPEPFRLAYTTSKEYVKADIGKETQWLKDKLGDSIPVDIKNGLIYLAQSGKRAFGQFRRDSIVLSNVAEVGTAYHEAYHRVSLLYLDDNQRQEIYNEAKRRYASELPDKASNKQVEEFLAEKFREYVLNKNANQDHTIFGKIGEFFSKLYQIVKQIFTGKNRLTNLDIDKLFTSIQTGMFRTYTPLQSNLDALGYKTYEMTYKGEELDNVLNYKQMQSLTRGLSALAMEGVTSKLFEEGHTKYATIDAVESLNSLDLNGLKNTIKDLGTAYDNRAVKNSQILDIIQKGQLSPELASQLKDLFKVDTITQIETKARVGLETALRLSSLYKEVYNNYDNIFRDRIKDYITKELGIRTINEEQEEENITNKEIGNFDKENFEISAKDNISNAIKFLLHNLHESSDKDPLTGLHNFAKFDEVWSRLANDLHGEQTIEDMINILESTEYFPYQQLSKKLKLGSELLRTQFLTSLRKHRHAYINAMFRSITDEAGNVSHPFYFVDADIQEVSKNITRTWGEVFAMSSFFEEGKLDKKKLDPIFAKYTELKTDYNSAVRTNSIINTKEYKDRLINILNSLHIDVDSATIDRVLNDTIKSKVVGTEEGALGDLINRRLFHLFSKEHSTLYKFASSKDTGSKITMEPKTLFRNESTISEMAQAYAKVNITNTSDNVSGPDGNNRHVFADNSYVTDVIRKLTTDDAYLKKINSDIFSRYSRLLDQLKDKDVRDKVSVKTFNSIIQDKTSDTGRDYLTMSPIEDFLFKMYLTREGYTVFPTLADRRTYYLLDGFKGIDFNYQKMEVGLTIPDEIVDIFYKYAEAEENRINQAWKMVKSYSTLDGKGNIVKVNDFKQLVENYHYVTEGKNKNIDKGLAYKYQLFNSFNDIKNFDLKTMGKDEIRKILESNIERVVKYSKDNGIITSETIDGKELLKSKLLDKTTVDRLTKEFGGDEDAAIRSMLASYCINSLSASIENTMLFSGDIAFYKANKGNPVDDYIKRLSVLTSSGVIPRENIPGEFENETYNTATLIEQKLKSTYYDVIRDRQRQLLLPKYGNDINQVDRILDKTLRDYDGKVQPTDAQVYLSPEMFREISIRRGNWPDKMQSAFDLLNSTEPISEAEEQSLFNIVMQPLKYVYFDRVNYDINDNDKLLIPIYDKMSMATLFRRFVGGTHLEDLLDRMEAKGKYENMEKIHMIKYETAVKVGNRSRGRLINNPNTNEQSNYDYSKLTTYSQNFGFLRHQVVTDPHELQKTLFGSQVKKILQANIINENDYNVNGNPVKGKELKNNINKILSTLSDKETSRLLDRLNVDYSTGKITNDDFYKLLGKEAKIAGLPENIQEGLRMQLPIDILPERKWVFNRFIATINKYAIDLHLPGNQLIQMSGYGLASKDNTESTNDLKFIFDKKSKDAKITGIEAKVSVQLFSNVIPDYEKKSFEDKKKWLSDNPDVLEGIGYRIPTQGQNSTVFLKIVGFIPEQMGDVIVLPNEFTALTGSDFDIDKLFFIRYNYKTNKEGKPSKVKFLDDSNSTIEKRYDTVAKESFYDHKNLFDKESGKENYNEFKKEIQEILVNKKVLPSFEEFSKLDPIQQNTKLAIQNHLLDHYKSILLSEDHFLSTSTPLGAVTNRLKSLSDIVTEAESEVSKERQSLDFANPVAQAEVKYKYSGGKFGVGPSALSNAHNILCQVADVSFKDNIGIGIEKDGKTSLHELYGLTERDGQKILISDWLSALIDSHVDIAKDPYIINLNVVRRTYNMIGLLLRTGVGEKSFEFLSQPILKELVKNSTNLDGNILDPEFQGMTDSQKNKKIITDLKIKWNSQLDEAYKKFTQTEEQVKSELTGYNPFSEDLLELLKTPVDKRDGIWYAKQLRILEVFDSLDSGPAKELSRLVMSSRVDTKKYGNNLNELKLYMDSIRDVYKENAFTNIDRLIPYNPETNTVPTIDNSTFLGSYLKNSILLINQLMEDKTITATIPFNDLIDTILQKSSNKYASNKVSLVNKIADDIHTAFLSRFFTDSDKLNLKPNQVASIFNKVTSFVMDVNSGKIHPELKENYLIQSLIKGVSTDNDDKSLPIFLGIPTVKADDNFVKENLTFAWQELLQSSDKDVKDFAKQLFVYSFYTSGFKKGLFSIFHYIPPQLFKELEVKRGDTNDILSFAEYINDLNDSLRDPSTINMTVTGIADEVFRNNWNNEKLVPQIQKEKVFNAITESNKQPTIVSIYFNKKSFEDRKLYLGPNEFQQPVFKPYIHYIVNDNTSYLMQYIGYNESNDSPVYKTVEKMGYYNKGKVIKEYGLEHSFLERNKVTSLTDEQVKDTLSKNKFYSSFTYIDPEFREVGSNKTSEETINEMPMESTTEDRSLNVGAEIGQETSPIVDDVAKTRLQERTENKLPLC